MKQEELLKHIDKIGMMSREQADEFAATVHNAVGINREDKEMLLSAIDDRIAKLNNRFSLEVEMSELCCGDVEI
jgi:adenosine deaminase